MNVFFTVSHGRITLRASAEGDNATGDFFHTLAPGEDVFGVSYDELMQHAPGGKILVDDDGNGNIVVPD
jgi:hypothetical protein